LRHPPLCGSVRNARGTCNGLQGLILLKVGLDQPEPIQSNLPCRFRTTKRVIDRMRAFRFNLLLPIIALLQLRQMEEWKRLCGKEAAKAAAELASEA